MSDSSTKRTPVQPRGQKVMGLQVQGAACLLIHGRLPAAERRPLSFAKRGRSTKRTPAQPRVSKRSVRARAAHCLFACIGLFAHSRPTPRGGATTEVIAMRGRSTKSTPVQPRAPKRYVRARAGRCLFACMGLFAHSRPTPRGGATTEVIAMRGRSTKRTPVQPRAPKRYVCLLIHGRLPALERRPESLFGRSRVAYCLFAHSRPTISSSPLLPAWAMKPAWTCEE